MKPSRFFDIVIRMFVEPGAPHHRPHFHSLYSGESAVFAIDVIKRIGGSLLSAQQRLAEAWAEIHGEELQRDWELSQLGQSPVRIESLH